MYRFILVIVLLVFSNITFAANNRWLKVDSNTDFNYFIDTVSLSKENNIVKVWVLVDYLSPQDAPQGAILSMKNIAMFNCNTRENQFVFINTYSKNNGDGKLLASEKLNDNWEPVVPGTINEMTFNLVCK